ncbi:hypothetical protein ACFL22_00790 [Patescibacteria group bacterium]
MNTAMSDAFAKIGFTPKDEASDNEIPDELLPYTEQIKEIARLGNLFIQHKVPMSILDQGTLIAFNAVRNRGELKEAYDMLVSHMQKKASEQNIS